MVISRRLNKIASTNSVSNSRSDRRRALMTDLGLGLAPPIISMATSKFFKCLHLLLFLILTAIVYIVQGHRFDIYEGIGPVQAVPNTYIYTVYAHGSNLLIAMVSATYSSTLDF
jgi:pheromone a factor receptor